MSDQTLDTAAVLAAHSWHGWTEGDRCWLVQADASDHCLPYRLAAALAAAQKEAKAAKRERAERLVTAWSQGWKALEVQLHEQQPDVYWFDQPNPYRAALAGDSA